ncbi:MAG: hypothetical protein C0514_01970 [Candidatus Puniceispirillum sp.]|nr:hypothetical protein [Candidatus Puniceispirillum sp.]
MTTPTKPPLSKNHREARAARMALTQALFQIHATQASAESVKDEFLMHRLGEREDYPDAPNVALFSTVFETITRDYESLASHIQELLPDESTLDKHEPVLQAILKAGAAELLTPHPFAPAPVVISEYVHLTIHFCGKKQGAFVNGILDALARKLNKPLSKA